MLVVGPLFQIVAFLVQFLELPFPIFALSFGLGGIGRVFQVGIIYPSKITINNYRSRMHLRMPSSRLFKMTLNTNWALYRLHTVQLFPNTPSRETNIILIHNS